MKKDVYKYYMEQVDSYNNLKKQLEDLSSVKEANKEAFEYIKGLVDTMEANVARLSYIVYLMKLPLLGKVRKAYEGNYVGLKTLFKKYKADKESIYEENDAIMQKVITFMNSLPDKEDTKEKKPARKKAVKTSTKKKEDK